MLGDGSPLVWILSRYVPLLAEMDHQRSNGQHFFASYAVFLTQFCLDPHVPYNFVFFLLWAIAPIGVIVLFGVGLTGGGFGIVMFLLFSSYAFVFIAVALLARGIRVRAKPGICSNCGYDLRATPDRCPECGTIPQSIQLHGRQPPSRLASNDSLSTTP